MLIQPYDREQLRQQFNSAEPFRWFTIYPFLEETFATKVVDAYPSFEDARALGHMFNFVNEQRKVQVTDSSKFPSPVKQLSDFLASPQWLEDVEYITGIPRLVADEGLEGGGMHVTGAGGRLDVHVDFNFHTKKRLHRRLNILVYLNRDWEPAWGGNIELWDKEVKRCHHSFSPAINRCVVFETNDISYHGVQPVTCPPERARLSFAAYYYTVEAPERWDGKMHDTIFRARPAEKLRGMVLMPLETAQRKVAQRARRVASRLRGLLGR
jgi:Rps23 Pro-64 3,4-dihydroxylase Tpa1-like proline 4-hydroxylase